MGAISPFHLIIVLVVAILVIGPGKLPEVGSALGRSIREFRQAVADVQDPAKLDAAPSAPAPAQAAVAPVAAAAPAAPPDGAPGA